MKRLLFGLLPIFLLTLTGFAQTDCKRQVEPGGGFSYCIPEGWKLNEKQGEKYKFAYTSGDTFSPNLNIKEDVNTSPLTDYVAASNKYILDNYQKTGATSMKLVAQDDFVTTSGLKSIRMSYRAEFKGLILRVLQYYFSGKAGQRLIVTCTALEEDKATLDPIFERALKSFELDK